MNFLELVQATARKCAISGVIASVTTTATEAQRIVDWVNESWLDIQNSNKSWAWMREDFAFSTVAGQNEYTVLQTAVNNFGRWHTESMRIQRASLTRQDEQFICCWDWQDFRDTYLYGVSNQGRPTVFAVRPKGSGLVFGNTPDAIYLVTGEYQRKALRMPITNISAPDMPDEYHMAIVHKARMKYASFENAPEVMAEAMRDFDLCMSGLNDLQVENISTGQPLA